MDSWELGPQDIIILGQLGEGNFGEVYRGLVKFEVDAPATRYHSETIGNLLVAVKLLKCVYTSMQSMKCSQKMYGDRLNV